MQQFRYWLVSPSHRRGFTLMELLVVVAVIVLLVTMAVPAFNILTGARSVEAAQNRISAHLARAREQALAVQDRRGVIFFHDPAVDRMIAGFVYSDDPGGRPTQIELVPNQELLVLAPGVGVRFVGGGLDGERYAMPGVIMFDDQGRLMPARHSIRANGALAQRMGTTQFDGGSHAGLVLFDLHGYRNAASATRAQWLDDHGVPLLVNRFNGTLVKGE